jgi:hypothetical protein
MDDGSYLVLWYLFVYVSYIYIYRILALFYTVYCKVQEINGVMLFFFNGEFYISLLFIEFS